MIILKRLSGIGRLVVRREHQAHLQEHNMFRQSSTSREYSQNGRMAYWDGIEGRHGVEYQVVRVVRFRKDFILEKGS